jgi:antitoxin CptB
MAVNLTRRGDQAELKEQGTTLRAKLFWQCRRGMLELDLVLQAFLDHQYDKATADERRAFESLLKYPDALLFEYVMGRVIPSDQQLANVVSRLRSPASA